MILYHNTKMFFVDSILRYGLIPKSKGWVVYLSPCKNFNFGEVLLEVETDDNNLTAFENCKEWEVLCWGYIPPENIKYLGDRKYDIRNKR